MDNKSRSPLSGDALHTPISGKTSANKETHTHTHTHTETFRPPSSSHRAVHPSAEASNFRAQPLGRGGRAAGNQPRGQVPPIAISLAGSRVSSRPCSLGRRVRASRLAPSFAIVSSLGSGNTKPPCLSPVLAGSVGALWPSPRHSQP